MASFGLSFISCIKCFRMIWLLRVNVLEVGDSFCWCTKTYRATFVLFLRFVDLSYANVQQLPGIRYR
jgi:hypothetical protein